MSQFDQIFDGIRNSENYEENARLLEYLGNIIRENIRRIPESEKNEIKKFALSEMERILNVIPKAKNYREEENLFAYEDRLLMIYTVLGKPNESAEAEFELIKKLVAAVSAERTLENAVDEMFKLSKIEKSDVDKALAIASSVKDDYQRSMLYRGINEYKEKIKNMTAEARASLADFTAAEMERLLKNPDTIDEDGETVLEFALDVCKYYADDRLLGLLEKAVMLDKNIIKFFAFETLLENKRNVSDETVRSLAQDLKYALFTKRALDKCGKGDLFPKELDTAEYLAKSDLAHWLTYPTELNALPDEIELLGVTKIKGAQYHVFKYKSDSDNLGDDLKNVWLIGWSGDDGGTFSNFDKLSDFEKKTSEKTLKHIIKKLIK